MRREIIKRHNLTLEFLPKVVQFLEKNFRKKDLIVNKKGATDLVTEADKGSEKMLTSFIRSHFPDDPILGEEGGVTEGRSPFKWIIDPLDGTTNFASRIPLYAISIGIEDLEYNKMESGIIALPSLGDIYHAICDKGAFKNKKKIQVSKKSNLLDSVLCTGFPYRNEKRELERILNNLRNMLTQARGIRRTGAAALDLCWVAEGRFDGFWEERLSPWDIAAGGLIIQEAGGRISSFEGENFHPYIKNVLAGNAKVHTELLKFFKQKSNRKK